MQYTGYVYHLSRWLQAFKVDCDADMNTAFTMSPDNEGAEGDDDDRINSHHLLEYLFVPRAHLSSYEHLLGCLARYTSRAGQPTKSLEDAIGVLKRVKRRVVESQQLWPFVENMPTDGSLGLLPSTSQALDISQLPAPVTRLVCQRNLILASL